MRRPSSPAPSTLPLACLAALALALGACSGDDGDAEPDGSATATATTDATTEPLEEPTDDASEPADDDEAASGGAACVEGTWTADNAAAAESTTSAPGMADLGATASVTGTSTVTFSGDTVTVEYDGQTTEVTWAMQGQELRMVMTFDGTLTGTVDVTDDTVVFQDGDDSALTIDYTTSVDGQELAVPGVDGMISSGFEAGSSSTYTCTADTLELTPVVEGVDTSGVVTVLRR